MAPKHFVALSDKIILWFEPSNKYIVISKYLWEIVRVYLDSLSESEFLENLNFNLNIQLDKGKVYLNEISEFLIVANSEVNHKSEVIKSSLIPEFQLVEYYTFGNFSIKINFGSEQIKALIHPQWANAISQIKIHDIEDFYIFKEDDFLYLINNKNYVGRFPTSEYHLLQGQFALQLINTLYNKIESDWIATFHASTVCNNQEAVMLIGDSGNGKSTLSAILMAHGIDVLADDFTPLSADNKEVYRFPSGISVKTGSFEMLKPLFPDFDNYPVFKSTSKNVNVKYIPPLKNMEEGPSHLPCRKIVYVKFDKNTTSTIQEIGIEKILETLIPESWISPLAQNSKLFLEWLKDLECYELNYSDNDFAVASIKKLFNS